MNELYAGYTLLTSLIREDLIHDQLLKGLAIDYNSNRHAQSHSIVIDKIIVDLVEMEDWGDKEHMLGLYRDIKKQIPFYQPYEREVNISKKADEIYQELKFRY